MYRLCIKVEFRLVEDEIMVEWVTAIFSLITKNYIKMIYNDFHFPKRHRKTGHFEDAISCRVFALHLSINRVSAVLSQQHPDELFQLFLITGPFEESSEEHASVLHVTQGDIGACVLALQRRTGASVWKPEGALLHRSPLLPRPTSPAENTTASLRNHTHICPDQRPGADPQSERWTGRGQMQQELKANNRDVWLWKQRHHEILILYVTHTTMHSLICNEMHIE